jgi:hypothetical protein
MAPDLVADFIAGLNSEWRRLAAEAKVAEGIRLRERTAIERKIANLVGAISDGRSSAAILAKLEILEAQRRTFERDPAPMASSRPALHPGIAQLYAAKVCTLNAALARGRDCEMLETARALIDKVFIHPPENDDDPPGVELVGDLMAMLQAAGVGRPQAKNSAAVPDPVLALFVSSVKEDPRAFAPA